MAVLRDAVIGGVGDIALGSVPQAAGLTLYMVATQPVGVLLDRFAAGDQQLGI